MEYFKHFFNGFKKGMNNFGQIISVIINSILLLIAYIIGIGLTSVAAKIFKKNFLDTKIDKKRKSYWSDLDIKKKPIEEYYRQF